MNRIDLQVEVTPVSAQMELVVQLFSLDLILAASCVLECEEIVPEILCALPPIRLVPLKQVIPISAIKSLPINVVASITGQNLANTMKHYMGVINVEKFRELTNKVKFQ